MGDAVPFSPIFLILSRATSIPGLFSWSSTDKPTTSYLLAIVRCNMLRCRMTLAYQKTYKHIYTHLSRPSAKKRTKIHICVTARQYTCIHTCIYRQADRQAYTHLKQETNEAGADETSTQYESHLWYGTVPGGHNLSGVEGHRH